ncbi:MAG: ECF transporter S component [Bacilli bacterium]|nr:ECF transporter S component [Bacilli bacterium]MDD4077685.1 ECF transporter S component [Bacilli bacterium]
MNNKKTARNREIFNLVFASALIAIIIVLTVFAGYINFGFVQITIIHIPVIIGAIILGKRYGLILGLVFGLGAMIRSFVEVLPQNVIFTNPLLSVLPRMFFGYITAVLYQFLRTKIKKESLAVTFTMILATTIHTVVVVPLLYVIAKTGFYFYAADMHEAVLELIGPRFFPFLLVVIINNSLWEIAAAAVIGTPITLAVNQQMVHRYQTMDRK